MYPPSLLPTSPTPGLRTEQAAIRYNTDPLHHARVHAVQRLLTTVGRTFTTEQISLILNADDFRGLP